MSKQKVEQTKQITRTLLIAQRQLFDLKLHQSSGLVSMAIDKIGWELAEQARKAGRFSPVEERSRDAAAQIMGLSRQATDTLLLLKGTTRRKPRRQSDPPKLHRGAINFLVRRGLAEYRCYDGTPGGYFITKAGNRKLAEAHL